MKLKTVRKRFIPIFILGFFLTSVRPYPQSELINLHFKMRHPFPADAQFHLPLRHAHNDFEHFHPLQEALASHFESVEADIWLHQGKIQVSHMGLFFNGTLEDLYLDPLQKRIDQLGSVYGDNTPFHIWLDIKDESPEMATKIYELLKDYPMLQSKPDSEKKLQSPVQVILTGSGVVKSEYFRRYASGEAQSDQTIYNSDHPHLTASHPSWQWYSLNWFDYFSWNGEGDFPQTESRKLSEMIADIHHKGRKVRFYGTPEIPELWAELAKAQSDMISTDDLDGLTSFLENLASVFKAQSRTPRIKL